MISRITLCILTFLISISIQIRAGEPECRIVDGAIRSVSFAVGQVGQCVRYDLIEKDLRELLKYNDLCGEKGVACQLAGRVVRNFLKENVPEEYECNLELMGQVLEETVYRACEAASQGQLPVEE